MRANEDNSFKFPLLDGYVTSRTTRAGEIRYYDRGTGAPVVLIHGMFGDFLDWEPVLEPLAESFRVIAVDLTEFGGSSKPRAEYSAEFFVSALHELFEQLDLKQFVVAGNSFGGQIAILYALVHPDAVSKLVLVNSGGFRKYGAYEIAQVEARFGEQSLAALTPQINAFLFANVFTKTSPTSVRYLEKQNSKLRRGDYPAYAYAHGVSACRWLPIYWIGSSSCRVLRFCFGERRIRFSPSNRHSWR